MDPSELAGTLEFLRSAERLKNATRSAWTSEGHQESVAEHTWRLCLMSLVLRHDFPDVDFARLVRICIVHDLGEAIHGDIPAPEQARRGVAKADDERRDLMQLLQPLPAELRDEISSLWDEYETARTPEARLAKALDKLETVLQHNQGQNPADFDYRFNLDYGRRYTEGHPLIGRCVRCWTARRSNAHGSLMKTESGHGVMGTERLEAFSDGVIAILITIMVLELRIPHTADLASLVPLVPVFASYVLSFVYLGIYWNNHHHMLLVTDEIDGAILWANLHLLFWLSLVTFVTAWMGENHFAPVPTAAYGVVMLCASMAYWILQGRIIARQGEGSILALAIGRDAKGKISPLCYVIAIVGAFVSTWISDAMYVLVALMWLIPDRRIERVISRGGPSMQRRVA